MAAAPAPTTDTVLTKASTLTLDQTGDLPWIEDAGMVAPKDARAASGHRQVRGEPRGDVVAHSVEES